MDGGKIASQWFEYFLMIPHLLQHHILQTNIPVGDVWIVKKPYATQDLSIHDPKVQGR